MIALTLCVPIVASGQPQPNSKGDGAASHDQTTQTDQRGSDASPLAIRIEGAPTREQQAADHGADIRRHDIDEGWAIKIGVAAIIAALIQAGVLVWQIIYLRGTLTHNRDSTQKELRAYVFPREMKYTQVVTEIDQRVTKVICEIVFTNTGKTPARKVDSDINFGVFPGEIGGDFAFPSKGPEQGHAMGPGQNTEIHVEILPPDLLRVIVGKEHLYVWGWFEYTDTFEGTPRRRTEFAVEVGITGGALMAGQLIFANRQLPTFNGSDEDCQRQPKTC